MNLIRQKAMDLLARREHTERELKQKLVVRGYSAAEIDSVLRELSDKQLQSDARFAENYVRMRSQKGYGPLHIQQALQQRGVARELVYALLKDERIDWIAYAHKAASKKSNHEKKIRFLQYRGFTPEQINAALHVEE